MFPGFSFPVFALGDKMKKMVFKMRLDYWLSSETPIHKAFPIICVLGGNVYEAKRESNYYSVVSVEALHANLGKGHVEDNQKLLLYSQLGSYNSPK